ncbi:hypothetical protein [Thiofaba sp. EF100]|uniref:hypothetical protein n=1 Tax=Thiofaba sp. EF100 TaxID=3121274 RepID=UPI0032218917
MLDLAAWHAEPLDQGEAETRLARLGTATAWTERLEALRLRLMLGLPATMQREVLMAEADDDLQRAAVELITGQVMLARRMKGAWDWLDAAEKRLAHRLPGPGYLALLRRHAMLRTLPLFDQPKAMRPLKELLAIAAATARLEGMKRPDYAGDQRDTLG